MLEVLYYRGNSWLRCARFMLILITMRTYPWEFWNHHWCHIIMGLWEGFGDAWLYKTSADLGVDHEVPSWVVEERYSWPVGGPISCAEANIHISNVPTIIPPTVTGNIPISLRPISQQKRAWYSFNAQTLINFHEIFLIRRTSRWVTVRAKMIERSLEYFFRSSLISY